MEQALFRASPLCVKTQRTSPSYENAAVPFGTAACVKPGEQFIFKAALRILTMQIKRQMIPAFTKNRGVDEKFSFSSSDQTRCQICPSASTCRPRPCSSARFHSGRRIFDSGTRRAMSSITSNLAGKLAGICRESHTSAIFVSHDLAVIRCLCDRVMILRAGALVEEGPTAQVICRPREAYTKKLVDSVLEIKN